MWRLGLDVKTPLDLAKKAPKSKKTKQINLPGPKYKFPIVHCCQCRKMIDCKVHFVWMFEHCLCLYFFTFTFDDLFFPQTGDTRPAWGSRWRYSTRRSPRSTQRPSSYWTPGTRPPGTGAWGKPSSSPAPTWRPRPSRGYSHSSRLNKTSSSSTKSDPCPLWSSVSTTPHGNVVLFNTA